jgi:hypothetical protein
MGSRFASQDTIEILERNAGSRSMCRAEAGLVESGSGQNQETWHAQLQRPRRRSPPPSRISRARRPASRPELQEPLRQIEFVRRFHCSQSRASPRPEEGGTLERGNGQSNSWKYFDGELKDIESIPEHLKRKHATVFSVGYDAIIDAAGRRQKWIDQSQSVNLFLAQPDMKTLSHMYRRAWHVGLKTTYYLRTLQASNIEKSTISVKKEISGIAGGKREYSPEEQLACSIEARRNGAGCEACQ